MIQEIGQLNFSFQRAIHMVLRCLD